MADNIISWLTNTQAGHLALIISLFTLCWGYCLQIKGWVSDDIEGIAKFSDRFIQHKNEKGEVVKEELITTYDHDTGKKDKDDKPIIKKFRHTQFNPLVGFPGSVLRWFRINFGKKFGVLGKNVKGHEVYGIFQDPYKHHLLSFLFQLLNIILIYKFLSFRFDPRIALLATMIFSVHPVSVQNSGWISGINYVWSLFGTLVSLNLANQIDNPFILAPLVVLSTAFSTFTLMPGSLTWIILLFLGEWTAGVTALVTGGLILAHQAWVVIRYRSNAFKEQNMGKSTTVYWRKSIIMVKTFLYYLKLVFFPKRLGLFHTYGYHFEEPLEHVNSEFWVGLLALSTYVFLFFISPVIVKFGLLWYFVYLLVFSNFITAQQFVSERYCFISSLGFSVVMAYCLQNYPVVIAFILGIYVMRVWFHLPSYKNEVRFYESNAYNFPDSEVALGNLGVAYLNHGLPGRAIDTWHEATRVNPHYDVPWYNLYSFAKQRGDVLGARDFLKKCINSKVVHFKTQWEKELAELETIILKATSQGLIQPQPMIKCS